MERFCLNFAALNGFLAVAAGAFGAHSLRAQVAGLPPEEAAKILGWVATGSQYQLLHAAALLALAALAPRLGPKAYWAAHGFAWGALLFSATLYLMALGAPRWLGAVTPLGGLGMLLGWLSLFWSAGSKRPN
jgi:uncharacterized membrane protein YgdD (TMEM256/DUF423 family)